MSGGATEWEDILIQHGILKAPNADAQKEPEIVYDLDNKENDSDLEGLDDEDDSFLESYRQKRLEQLKSSTQKRTGFGEVIEISRPDFVTEVTEASRQAFVLVHLYQSGFPACQLLSKALKDLCRMYPRVKFVEIQATRCIEKYPDHLVPTVIVYKDTNVYANLVMATPEKTRQILDIIEKHLNEENEE